MQCLWRCSRILSAVLFPVFLSACEESTPAGPVQLTAVERLQRDPAELARGQALYEGSCAAFCHDVESQDAAELFDCTWVHAKTDGEIFSVITDGIPDTRMVGFGSNFPKGDDDVWSLVAYIRHKQPDCPAAERHEDQQTE